MQTTIPFLISLAIFILIVSGMLGIAVNLFQENGLLSYWLGRIWNQETQYIVTAIPIIVAAIVLGKHWMATGLHKGGSSLGGNILLFLMMAIGGYFIFLYLTTGTLVYQRPSS